MPGPRITVQGVPPEEPEQDIAAQGEVFVRVERVTWGKVRGAGCDGDSGTLWRSEARSDKTRQRQRRAGPDHGPMACGRVSLRMKMSRPW